MKNLLLGALCIVVMSAAGFGGYTYYENQKQEQMDPWLKANLAALADLEKPTQGKGGGNAKMSESIIFSTWKTSDVFIDVDDVMKSLDCNYTSLSCVSTGEVRCVELITIDCVVRS